MATEAATLQAILYQIQQEYVYYTVETDPVKKQSHARNIQLLYGLLTQLLDAIPSLKVHHLPPPPPPPPPPAATVYKGW